MQDRTEIHIKIEKEIERDLIAVESIKGMEMELE